VFDLEAVKAPLTEAEILDSFRAGSQTIVRSIAEIEQKGLLVVPIPGAEPLPERLRRAHAEIRPGSGMTRVEFKQILKELE
jgi:2-iminoacetate synthase ThiH